ncbi:hypothetical protein SAY87_012209 [Trapa incisa]|uniref:Uncharacterized protein n=1 Tax=Trapa incisa TaxID=236973 RepID=A0AAN7JJB8_9MYRT|nr:hypothetical protein SAY87_012209 [Trapa incisa]
MLMANSSGASHAHRTRVQDALQVHRLREALSGSMQPRRPERPAATPDDRAGALLGAAPAEDSTLGELRRRILLPKDEQRDPERRHVPPGQLRFVKEGEQGAEARDLEDEGEAQRAREGADGDEAGDGGQSREREDSAEFDL